MCKINGHSIFSYMFQPAWNWKKLATSKKNGAGSAGNHTNTIENMNVSDTETTEKTGSLSSKKTKKQDLSSLKVPLNTSSTGATIGNQTSVGLNLGGY